MGKKNKKTKAGIKKSELKELVMTNTVPLPKEKQIDKIKQVSVAPLIGDAIKRINENRPVSPLFKQVFQSAQLEKK